MSVGCGKCFDGYHHCGSLEMGSKIVPLCEKCKEPIASKEKFTKGDWSISDINVDKSHIEGTWSVSVNGCLIAHVTSGPTFGIVDEIQKANSHLIAAAPEMYREIENDINNLNNDIDKLKNSFIGVCCSDSKFASIECDIEQNEYFRDRKVKLLAKARGDHEKT